MKYVFIFLNMMLLSICANAQTCTPDTSKHATGAYPQGGSVDTVYVGLAYSETITYVTLDDTTIVVTINPAPPTSVNARLDSVRIKNWSNPASLNLPQGLQAVCNIPGCTFPGGSRNCVRISGSVNNPTDTGMYALNLELTYYFTIMSAPFTGVNYSLPGTYSPFNIHVKSQPPAGISTHNPHKKPGVFPNPSTGTFTVSNIPAGLSDICVTDLSGRTLCRFENVSAGSVIAWPDNTQCGLYLVTIRQAGKILATLPLIKS